MIGPEGFYVDCIATRGRVAKQDGSDGVAAGLIPRAATAAVGLGPGAIVPEVVSAADDVFHRLLKAAIKAGVNRMFALDPGHCRKYRKRVADRLTIAVGSKRCELAYVEIDRKSTRLNSSHRCIS